MNETWAQLMFDEITERAEMAEVSLGEVMELARLLNEHVDGCCEGDE